MSGTATARAIAPERRSVRAPEEHTRHLEVAATAAQRRARPRLVYAVIVVGGIGAILLAQLLLSIATAGGAYRINALQAEQRDFVRQQAALGERLDVLNSTQNLTRDAEALGMVSSGDPVFLDATTGAVRGTATAAGGSLVGAGDLIGNALLSKPATQQATGTTPDPAQQTTDPSAQQDDSGIATTGAPVTTTPTTAPTTSPTPSQGAPAAPDSTPSVPSAPGVLPSPTTH